MQAASQAPEPITDRAFRVCGPSAQHRAVAQEVLAPEASRVPCHAAPADPRERLATTVPCPDRLATREWLSPPGQRTAPSPRDGAALLPGAPRSGRSEARQKRRRLALESRLRADRDKPEGWTSSGQSQDNRPHGVPGEAPTVLPGWKALRAWGTPSSPAPPVCTGVPNRASAPNVNLRFTPPLSRLSG